MPKKRRSGNQDSPSRTGARAKLREERQLVASARRLDALDRRVRDFKPATALPRQIERANPVEMYVRKQVLANRAAEIQGARAVLRVRDDEAVTIARTVVATLLKQDRQRALDALTHFVAHAGMPHPLADAVDRWHANVLNATLPKRKRRHAREALAAVGKGLTSVTSGRPKRFDPDALADRRAVQTAECKALARLKRRFNKNLSHFTRTAAFREALGDSSDGLSEGEASGRGLTKESRAHVRARFEKWERQGRHIE